MQRYSFFNLDTRWRWIAKDTYRPLYRQERDPVPAVEGNGWAGPGTIWTCGENLVTTGIRSPDRSAHSESLYRLRIG
jgi:hypothetical protein